MGRLCARKRKGEMDKLQHEIKGGGVGMGYNVNVIRTVCCLIRS